MDKITELADMCRQLRLSRGLAERAMTQEGSTHQEYLINLFRAELKARREQRIEKCRHSAGFPYEESFNDFRTDEIEFPDTLSYAECRDLKFIREKKNILMYGRTGTGKTMLSICLGIEACRQGIPVQFYRTAALINRMTEYRAAGKLTSFKEKLNRADILILDEFGYVPYDLTGSQILFDYLSEIHEKKIIILTTNKEFSQWSNILFDEDMAAALIGRLTHHCHLILFPGEDQRLKNSSIRKAYGQISRRSDNV